MTLYRVTWEIDIDADNALDAAGEALAIQRDTESWATCFSVQPFPLDKSPAFSIDLSEDQT